MDENPVGQFAVDLAHKFFFCGPGWFLCASDTFSMYSQKHNNYAFIEIDLDLYKLIYSIKYGRITKENLPVVEIKNTKQNKMLINIRLKKYIMFLPFYIKNNVRHVLGICC